MQFAKPKENLLQGGLAHGMRVADLGSGAGHYAHAAAAIVGEDGKVYAIEVREDMLKHIRGGAREHHQERIETVWGDIEKPGGTGLRDHSMDALVLANVLFQIENREGLIAEAKRVLKGGGKLLVIDWVGSYKGIGPREIVPEHAAEEIFIGGGFYKEKSFRAGAHHYGLVFKAP